MKVREVEEAIFCGPPHFFGNTMKAFILLMIFAVICYAMIVLHDLTDTKIDNNDDEVD